MSHGCPICTLRHHPNCDPERCWPVRPLIDLVGGFTELARRAGVSGAVVTTALDYGLTDRQADRWAVRCGTHPGAVWPDWFDKGLTVHDAAFVAGGWRRAWLHDSAVAS